MIKHIIWDWNGTLLDDVHACVASINVLLSRYRLPRIGVHRYREIFCFPVRRYYDILGFRFTEAEWNTIADEYHSLYAHFAARTPLRKGVPQTLRNLRRMGIASSILSASEITLLRGMLHARHIVSWFDHVAGLTNRFAHSKVAIGHDLIARSGFDPDDIVLIGDTDHDVEVARSLGCACILLAEGHQSLRRLRACGVPVMQRTEEICAHVIRRNAVPSAQRRKGKAGAPHHALPRKQSRG